MLRHIAKHMLEYFYSIYTGTYYCVIYLDHIKRSGKERQHFVFIKWHKKPVPGRVWPTARDNLASSISNYTHSVTINEHDKLRFFLNLLIFFYFNRWTNFHVNNRRIFGNFTVHQCIRLVIKNIFFPIVCIHRRSYVKHRELMFRRLF